MEWVEVTGRTVEEAKEAALDELGVDEQDAEFEILEEPKGRLFGRLRSEARVRARVVPTAPPPKVDRRERRRPRRKNERTGGEGSQPRRVRENDQRPPRRHEEETVNGDLASMDEVERAATAFLEGLLERLELPATVTSNDLDDETLQVSVHGEGLGLLIGHRGQALSALQEVTRTVVQRQVGTYRGRLVVDVGSYRQHRAEALARFSRQVAEQVLASGVPRVLEPMSPADRKVVHDTLSTVPGVATTSEGEEPRRRVVVSPDPTG